LIAVGPHSVHGILRAPAGTTSGIGELFAAGLVLVGFVLLAFWSIVAGR